MPLSSQTDVHPAADRRVSQTPQTNHWPCRVPYEQIGRSKGPSLNAPSVYRGFLAGDRDTLRPRLGSLLTLLLAGSCGLGIAWLITPPHNAAANITFLASAIGALACALILVLMVSRWLGNRLGMLTGLLWLGSIAVLGPQADTWLAATFCLAIGLFALANVPGRLPTANPRITAWSFYGVLCLAWQFIGPEIVVAILAICFATMLITQNIQAARFLFNPIGLGIFVTTIVGRWLCVRFILDGHNAIAFSLGTWTSSWTIGETGMSTSMIIIALFSLTPAIVAMVTGLHQGYHYTPFGRLLSCWILIPFVLCALGIMSYEPALAIAFPAISLLWAAGFILVSRRLGLLRRFADIGS